MLVLTRKKGESIIVDDCIEISVISVEGDVIKLGIKAPQHISIHRKEIFLQIQQENKLAAEVNFDFDELRVSELLKKITKKNKNN